MGNKNKKVKERWNNLPENKQKQTQVSFDFKLIFKKMRIKEKIIFLLIPLDKLGLVIIKLLSFLWKNFLFSWFFRQIGRLGLYLFFKNASKAGVVLWLMATGATDTILAFPFFFYFVLSPKFTKKYFGLSWGFGFLKSLVGFTGLFFFFVGFFKSL